MQITEARFFIIAVGLHAALPILAFVAPSPAAEEAPAPIEVAIEIDVEATKPPPPEPVALPAARSEVVPNPEETPRPNESPRTERPATGIIEPGPAPTGVVTAETPSTSAPVAPVAPTGTSEYDGPPPAVPGGPISGLPGIGSHAWSIPGVVPDMGTAAAAPTAAPKATVDTQIATKVLNQALKEKDKALGLDLPAGGTIASSVRSAVTATATPPESRATFEVRLSPTGQVLGVRVTSSTGGSSDAWAGAAKAVQAALAGRTLAMKSGFEKGAIVYVSVSSALTLPDGSKSSIERDGAGAKFDLANIGAHMQRVVKTSFSVVAVK